MHKSMNLFWLLFFSSSLLKAGQGAAFLEGHWAQGCAGRNFQTQLFRDGHVTTNENYFADTDCRLLLLRFQIRGLADISKTDLASGHIDYEFEETRVEVLSEELALHYNERAVCGWTDWKVSEPRRVDGLACDFFGWGQPVRSPSKGERRYGIWKIEQDRLHFGRLSPGADGTAPDRRPQSWNPRGFQLLTD